MWITKEFSEKEPQLLGNFCSLLTLIASPAVYLFSPGGGLNNCKSHRLCLAYASKSRLFERENIRKRESGDINEGKDSDPNLAVVYDSSTDSVKISKRPTSQTFKSTNKCKESENRSCIFSYMQRSVTKNVILRVIYKYCQGRGGR